MSFLGSYFRGIYQDAMSRAYDTALTHVAADVNDRTRMLDCGASDGLIFDRIASRAPLQSACYQGIEWNADRVDTAVRRGLDVRQGDLNKSIAFDNDTFTCICALSVLEHLLNPCRFMKECHRVLRPGGSLVLLTPNISTYFTAALILAGRMPSSGPHPDSDELLKSEELFKVSSATLVPDPEADTPVHRHLVVFSYRVLRTYLHMLGFTNVSGRGFGLYPFPVLVQPMLETIDPYHCHQMVWVARK